MTAWPAGDHDRASAIGAIWVCDGDLDVRPSDVARAQRQIRRARLRGHHRRHARHGQRDLSIILKWKMQFACAVVWWASAVIACFGSENSASIAFLAAIFFCQIVFGIYAMICEVAAAQAERSGPCLSCRS